MAQKNYPSSTSDYHLQQLRPSLFSLTLLPSSRNHPTQLESSANAPSSLVCEHDCDGSRDRAIDLLADGLATSQITGQGETCPNQQDFWGIGSQFDSWGIGGDATFIGS